MFFALFSTTDVLHQKPLIGFLTVLTVNKKIMKRFTILCDKKILLEISHYFQTTTLGCEEKSSPTILHHLKKDHVTRTVLQNIFLSNCLKKKRMFLRYIEVFVKFIEISVLICII